MAHEAGAESLAGGRREDLLDWNAACPARGGLGFPAVS